MPSQAKVEKEGATDTEHISLKVSSQDGSEVFFRIKKHTPLRKLMDAYCTRQGIDSNSIRFLFDGERVMPDSTAKDLQLQDGDLIDAVLMQTGGF